MATLYISEFSDIGTSRNARAAQVAEIPAVTVQTVTVSATASQSAVFNIATHLVRLQADTVCSVSFGTNPTATTTGQRMAASQTEYFTVPSNASYKVSVVSNT